jgi:hypothetical protein
MSGRLSSGRLRENKKDHEATEEEEVATLVATNANEVMVGSGGVCIWQELGVWSVESSSRFCVDVFGHESGFSHYENIFTFNLVCKEI